MTGLSVWWNSQKSSVKWMIAILVGSLLFSLLSNSSKSETTGSSKTSTDLTYKWQTGKCDEWGFEGVFTNQSSKTKSYKLWAEVVDSSGKQIDRDFEIVQDLKPGQSETVEFIFGASKYAKCRFVSVDVY
jgi:hypothetical protein